MYHKEQLQKELFALQDLKYRDFHSKLLPGVDKETIIGIRTPVLRKFAKEFSKRKEAEEFLQDLPHQYYEENNLHMMIITGIKDYDKCLEEIKKFVPYINNWATCDLPLPKCFGKHKEELLPQIREWIASDHTYTIRYGLGTLMSLYLDEDFKPEYLELAASVRSEEYYVNMMIAWYFATALAKQWEATVPYIEQRKLPQWVHRKTIQKAVESYRITSEQKTYLKSFRREEK
ncbi:DNA alkylation repair protein [Blautia sp. HCP28S3_G10]|uniref:DNA alkylation repair protein n=1 Tax=Blautia sp. HCP28S3_G10 TaxID=3438908 RepID=UPI003F8C65C8